MKRITMLLGAGILLLGSMVFAGVPQLINFQGILRDGSGNPVANGSYSVLFKIYDDSTGGNVLWSETQTVNTTNGLFSAILGSVNPTVNPIPDSAFSNTAGGLAHWLGIKVGADPEMTPRQKLVSVGYGYRSEHVNTVDGAAGGSITSPLSFGNSSSPELYIYESGTSNPTRPIISHSPAFPDWGLAYNDVNDRMTFQQGGSPVLTVHLGSSRVGIGILSPQNKFDVSGNATIGASYAGFNVAPANGLLVEGKVGIGTTSPTARLQVVTGFTSDKGIYASSGLDNAIYGTASASNAIVGEVTSSSYGGIVGINNDVGYAGQFYGYNAVSGDGGNVGVAGYGGNYGVYGSASNNGGYGIYGSNGGNSLTFAGYFKGDVYVNGNLGKAGGGFKIDHPLDPANKYLEHSFVESPDMKNIYDGLIVTDSKGNATVTLPEWFGALNKDFRYQLTVIGEFAQAIISKEIANNQFSIQTNKPSVKVSWQVTGIRQDAWANAHRIPVEQLKSGNERGSYIHPELFGQPEEKGVDWANHTETMKAIKEKKLQTEQK